MDHKILYALAPKRAVENQWQKRETERSGDQDGRNMDLSQFMMTSHNDSENTLNPRVCANVFEHLRVDPECEVTSLLCTIIQESTSALHKALTYREFRRALLLSHGSTADES
jgi:hypothetical protein